MTKILAPGKISQLTLIFDYFNNRYISFAKLSQAPAQLSGAELALFLENPDHPPIRNSTISMKEWS